MNNKRTRTRDAIEVIIASLEDGQIERWARAGATDRQIAQYLGVGKDSFIKAKKTLTDLTDRLQRARRPLVPEAFSSLVRLANGFEYTETVEENKQVMTQGGIVTLKTTTVYRKQQPPNLNAISRVIVNYQKQTREKTEGVPTDYIINPPETRQDVKQGRLPELDEALKVLFFGDNSEENTTHEQDTN